jgi:hypothetical protein
MLGLRGYSMQCGKIQHHIVDHPREPTGEPDTLFCPGIRLVLIT